MGGHSLRDNSLGAEQLNWPCMHYEQPVAAARPPSLTLSPTHRSETQNETETHSSGPTHNSDRHEDTYNSDLQLSLTHTYIKMYNSDTPAQIHKIDPLSTHTQHGNTDKLTQRHTTDPTKHIHTTEKCTQARRSYRHPCTQGWDTQQRDTLTPGCVPHLFCVIVKGKVTPKIGRPASAHLPGLHIYPQRLQIQPKLLCLALEASTNQSPLSLW